MERGAMLGMDTDGKFYFGFGEVKSSSQVARWML